MVNIFSPCFLVPSDPVSHGGLHFLGIALPPEVVAFERQNLRLLRHLTCTNHKHLIKKFLHIRQKNTHGPSHGSIKKHKHVLFYSHSGCEDLLPVRLHTFWALVELVPLNPQDGLAVS